MRRFAWSFSALAILAIACGPTGQTEVKPPADLQAKPAEPEPAKKAGGRTKAVNPGAMEGVKPID